MKYFRGRHPIFQSGPEQECDVNVTIFGRLNITGADMAECSWLVSCEGSMAEYSALKKAFAYRLNVVKNTPVAELGGIRLIWQIIIIINQKELPCLSNGRNRGNIFSVPGNPAEIKNVMKFKERRTGLLWLNA